MASFIIIKFATNEHVLSISIAIGRCNGHQRFIPIEILQPFFSWNGYMHLLCIFHQLVIVGFDWSFLGLHMGFMALDAVANIARADHVVPSSFTTSNPWHNMIYGEVVAAQGLVAVLAGEIVPDEQIRPGKPHTVFLFDIGRADDNGWDRHRGAGAMYEPVIIKFQGTCMTKEGYLDGILPRYAAYGYDAQGSIVGVQDKSCGHDPLPFYIM